MAIPTQDTRSALLDAALRCFAEQSYDGTSIRMIASRAGRPLSLIAHHFGSKEGLYIEVFRFLTAHAFTGLREGGRGPGTREEAIRAFREQVQSMLAETHSDDPARSELQQLGRRLFLSEMRDPRPEILELLRHQFQPWVDCLKACLHILRPDLGEAEIVLVGTAIMTLLAGQGLLEGISTAIWGSHGLGSAESARLLADFTLRGLGVDPERG